MGFDYALVHVIYTIPPALALTFLYRPLATRLDIYRVAFLVTIAVVATIPWDSYLIRSRIWSYPPDAVLGPVLWHIPIEELFFFVIQTYDTSLLYMFISRPTFYPAYLNHTKESPKELSFGCKYDGVIGFLGQLFLFTVLAKGIQLVLSGGVGTYMGLIVIWAFPFLLLLWSLSHKFMLRIPSRNILIPILVPTLYLWIVDTLALRRGTWVIETGTKYNLHVWEGLEIEEALFFLFTNALVVFGLIAFDHCVAIFQTFPEQFPNVTSHYFSPVDAIRALLTPESSLDTDRIAGMKQAISRLRKKSRSFYIASGAFEGRLRIDLVLLYSFCRVADDLIDQASDCAEASLWNHRLRMFLDLAYSSPKPSTLRSDVKDYVQKNFPGDAQFALLQLPVSKVSKAPLCDLLRGFETDLKFTNTSKSSNASKWPIGTESELDQYATFVAGTVAQLCIELALYHGETQASPDVKVRLENAGLQMGRALQVVNIARDIQVDAAIGRVYIPTDWLATEGLNAEAVLKDPTNAKLTKLRSRLLDKAFKLYEESRGAIEELPSEARGPMRVAVESYMEIGQVLRSENYTVKAGRATVPKLRRIYVAWRALTR